MSQASAAASGGASTTATIYAVEGIPGTYDQLLPSGRLDPIYLAAASGIRSCDFITEQPARGGATAALLVKFGAAKHAVMSSLPGTVSDCPALDFLRKHLPPCEKYASRVLLTPFNTRVGSFIYVVITSRAAFGPPRRPSPSCHQLLVPRLPLLIQP